MKKIYNYAMLVECDNTRCKHCLNCFCELEYITVDENNNNSCESFERDRK